ncbi:MAG: phosphoglucomutase [Planctomycetota bacterium]|nr:phosphoglucomutase [Planctomycetota bacterium]
MSIHPQAGQPIEAGATCDVEAVLRAYRDKAQRPVKFGTSGHRGRSIDGAFQEAHVAAITQAICDRRGAEGIAGPVFLGWDSHALSGCAAQTAIEVLVGNDVHVVLQVDDEHVSTPTISWAILAHNRAGQATADGIVITPSHNPPEDGGLKYNPPHGGPAGGAVTGDIERRANALLDGQGDVRRVPYEQARDASVVERRDLVGAYVDDLPSVVDIAAIREAGVKIGVDPLGGAGLGAWLRIAQRFGLDLEVVNKDVDPAFGFMRRDHDGKIRMDCSSPYAMAGLVEMRDRFDVAMGNDPDADRHGIVSRDGLMNPNHFLSLAIDYLATNRPAWREDARIGKTLVTSGLVDRVAASHGRGVYEVPVGFKWFAEPMFAGDLVFAGEESAGASLLQMDGTPWSTDKDGIALGLLAAEIRAKTGEDLGARFDALVERHGRPFYRRVDSPATDEAREAVGSLAPGDVTIETLAGDDITQVLSHAPGNDAPIGGIKLVTESGWMAARPSGTEPIVKVYAESFRDEAHLEALIEAGRTLVAGAGS